MTAILHFLITQHCAGCINTGVGRPGTGPQSAAETSPLPQHVVAEVGLQTRAQGRETAARDALLPLHTVKSAGTHLGGAFGGPGTQSRRPGGCRNADPQPIPL